MPKNLELRLIGLEASQIGGRVGANGDRLDHLGRIGQRQIGVEIGRQPRRLEPTAPRIARIAEQAENSSGIADPEHVANTVALLDAAAEEARGFIDTVYR